MSVQRKVAHVLGSAGQFSRAFIHGAKVNLTNFDRFVYPEKHQRKLLGLEWMPPMQIKIDAAVTTKPHLNILLPRLLVRHLTGGPNTALIVASGIAKQGVPVRLLAVDEAEPTGRDVDELRSHIMSVTGGKQAGPLISFGSTFDPKHPLIIGPADMFLATYWTTAFRLKPILSQMAVKEFIYLIQDYEPGFYAWSSTYAQVLETYSMRFKALINEQMLADHFSETKTGLFANPEFLSECTIFKPAVDRKLFYPERAGGVRKHLLFYARPSRPRNLFGIGFEALSAASRLQPFSDEDWSFTSIGDASLGPMDLGGGRTLEPASWLSFRDYARQMREADILLCPMLSPHTSYPVLEMAACRGIAVTNTFGTKTKAGLAAVSPRIVADEPTAQALANCLVQAAKAVSDATSPHVDVDLPPDWQAALGDAVLAARSMFESAQLAIQTTGY